MISEDYRTMMAATGITMQDVADETRRRDPTGKGRSLSAVNRQLMGENTLTVLVAEAVIALAKERVDRAKRLEDAAGLLEVAAQALAETDHDRGQYLFDTSELLKELAADQFKQRPGLHRFDMPAGWEDIDPRNIIYTLDGKPAFGVGDAFLMPDAEQEKVDQ